VASNGWVGPQVQRALTVIMGGQGSVNRTQGVQQNSEVFQRIELLRQ